jgi:hypothetical protein
MTQDSENFGFDFHKNSKLFRPIEKVRVYERRQYIMVHIEYCSVHFENYNLNVDLYGCEA